MEYSVELTNQQYIDNFKCCKNCSNWEVDYSLQGDYAYNGCRYWAEKKFIFLTPWAAFCDGYIGNKVDEGPFHKLILSNNNRLVFNGRD